MLTIDRRDVDGGIDIDVNLIAAASTLEIVAVSELGGALPALPERDARVPRVDLGDRDSRSPREETPREVAADVAELVAETGPPSAETVVGVRQKVSNFNGSINSVRRGQFNVIDAMNAPYPHIGAREDRVRFSTFVAFVADVKRAYDAYVEDGS